MSNLGNSFVKGLWFGAGLSVFIIFINIIIEISFQEVPIVIESSIMGILVGFGFTIPSWSSLITLKRNRITNINMDTTNHVRISPLANYFRNKRRQNSYSSLHISYGVTIMLFMVIFDIEQILLLGDETYSRLGSEIIIWIIWGSVFGLYFGAIGGILDIGVQIGLGQGNNKILLRYFIMLILITNVIFWTIIIVTALFKHSPFLYASFFARLLLPFGILMYLPERNSQLTFASGIIFALISFLLYSSIIN